MNTIVGARLAYDKLDDPNSKTRIRLSSPVVRVEHDGPTDRSARVRIAYRNAGKTCGVRARYCILACYNALIPSLMPEIPARQKEALAYPVKVPMLYTNVLLKKWTAFQKLGVSRISAPGMYHPNTILDPGSTVGGYQGVTTPEEPIIFHMTASPNKPGLPRKEQNRTGQQELLSMTFEQFELKIRDQMARMRWRPEGSIPLKTSPAITVNRWPYGYAYTYDTLADPGRCRPSSARTSSDASAAAG